MSFRIDRYQALLNASQDDYIKAIGVENITDLFLEILDNRMHGLCFSLYEDGQKPGDIISKNQIRKRLEKIQPYTKWVRSFSCIEGNEHIAYEAKSLGMQTLVGAWLGADKDKNALEIEKLIQMCHDGVVDIAAVGNEVLYRQDLTEEQLLEYIKHVKEQVNDVPVGYVDAYYEFVERPTITEVCDVILANCYPYWESCPIKSSLPYLKDMYYQAVKASQGKRVIITETGWPSDGEPMDEAIPSKMNALKYFINTQMWAIDHGIELFYFSSFDETWKISAEGSVGAYWGIWDKKENLKFV